MLFLESLSVSRIGLGLVLLYIGYYIHWELTIGASRRRISREYGCQPLRYSVDSNSWSENLFGWDFIQATKKAVKTNTFLELHRKRFLRNGTTIKFKALNRVFISTIEPENLKTIMASNFKDWNLTDTRKRAFVPLFGEGIFTTDGVMWQHSREILRPSFARNQIGDLEMLDRHVDHLLQAIPRDNSTVDLQELFFGLSLDFATEFLFGESTNSIAPGLSTESNAEFVNALNQSQAYIAYEGRRPLSGIFPNFQFKRDIKVVHSFIDRWVQLGIEKRKTHQSEKVSDGRYIFLDELAQSTEDPIQIRSELLNILLAGRDTTASLLSNTLFVLAKRPDIWSKLRGEVDRLGGERPTSEQIKNMKYMRAVLNESLRLYPVVPTNARMAVVDTVLPRGGGPDGQSPILIPAKQNVVWSVYSMHRRKDYYGEDAEEFRPERWESIRPTWEYLPFNGGPRICIGQQLALMEASYTIIRLMQEFKSIESRDPEPWSEVLSIVCSSLNGTKVALTPA